VLASSAGLRVLVVDDLEEMRILINRALSARGYEVEVAATLAEAHAMDPGGYDAVILDAHLGSERATDLVEALRAEDPAAARRCLVITGGTADTLPGDVAFLAKPFQLNELVDAVRALHQGDAAAAADRHAGIVPDPGARPAAAAPPGGNRRAGEPHAWELLRLTRRLRARERHELIDFLHDGPIQELTAVTLELQMMSRSAQPAPRFETVIKQLNAAASSLRWLVDRPWQSVQPEVRLAPSLQERCAWLLAVPLTVDSDTKAADLGVAEIPVVADVVELLLLGMVTASPPAQAHVGVRADERVIEIELTLISAAGDDQAIGDPVAAQSALDGLASALGAAAHASLHGRHWQARIVLDRQPASVLEAAARPARPGGQPAT
jgi:DNA-binding response OmpR family regulator